MPAKANKTPAKENREEQDSDTERDDTLETKHDSTLELRIKKLEDTNARLEELLLKLVNARSPLAVTPPTTTARKQPPPPPPLPLKKEEIPFLTPKKVLFSSAAETAPKLDILSCLKPKYAKESVMTASNACVQLTSINSDLFSAKFLDYLQTLGLKQALLATRTHAVDPTTRKATDKVNMANIDILRKDTKHAAVWAEAHLKLKACLSLDFYKELVIDKDKQGDQDFFDLWNLCLQKTGNTRTCDSMMQKRGEFDALSLHKGVFLSSFISSVGALADDVNRLGGTVIIPDFEKNRKLLLQAQKYLRFAVVCNMILPEIDSLNWKSFSEKFTPFQPKGPKGEEITLNEPDNDPTNNQEPAELANATIITCNFCNRRGHLEQDCRTKKYNGHSVPNKDCRNWVQTGRCTWEADNGRPCKFEHNQLTRNKKNWEPNIKRSQRQPNSQQAAAVTTTEEKAEVLALALEKLATKRQEKTKQAKAKDTSNEQANTYGVVSTEDMGLLDLVEGWTHHTHHNSFEVLSEDDEDSTQPSPKSTPAAATQTSQVGFKPTQGQKKKRRAKKRTPPTKQANSIHTNTQKGAVLLDSGCSKSTTPSTHGLTKITPKLVRMITANSTSNLSTKEGTMLLEGHPIRVSVVPNFDKTLVSLGELDKAGFTWTGGNGVWKFFDQEGVFWTQLSRGSDNLYHFADTEKQQQQQQPPNH